MYHASSIGGNRKRGNACLLKILASGAFPVTRNSTMVTSGKLLSMQWPPKCIRLRDLSRFNKLSDFFKVFP